MEGIVESARLSRPLNIKLGQYMVLYLGSLGREQVRKKRSGFATGGGAVDVRTFGGENIEGVDESGKSVFLISS
jgi:hypothetical protein